MCGRFAQYSSRNDYFESIGLTPEEILYDPEPIARFNVAPGTKVLLLNEREGELHFDPVYWGYGPEWWDKPPLINARGETAATGRMFKPLWHHGRAIVPADAWFEWKRDENRKQPYLIYHKRKEPLFFAAIGKAPFNVDHGREGFVIVTAASHKGMVDIHDRRPLVLKADVLREWLSADTSPQRAQEIAQDSVVPEEEFGWYEVSMKVGNPHNQGAGLIDRV